MAKKPEYETLSIKRANDKTVRDSTVFDLCDCCNKQATIIIEFSKRVPNKVSGSNKNNKGYNYGRPKKQIKKWYLCEDHLKEIKKMLNYFQ